MSIPEGWGDQEDWRAGFQEVEAVEKPLVRLQAELTAQIDTVRGLGSSPALLGWLALWNRTFQVLEGLRGATTRRSLQTCRILERVSFETALHLMVIAEPLGKPGDIRLSNELKRSAVQQRDIT